MKAAVFAMCWVMAAGLQTASASDEAQSFAVDEGYLSAAARQLVNSHGWALEWTSVEDRMITHPFTIQNLSLAESLAGLLLPYEGIFVADLYHGNKVVKIMQAPPGVSVELPETASPEVAGEPGEIDEPGVSLDEAMDPAAEEPAEEVMDLAAEEPADEAMDPVAEEPADEAAVPEFLPVEPGAPEAAGAPEADRPSVIQNETMDWAVDETADEAAAREALGESTIGPAAWRNDAAGSTILQVMALPDKERAEIEYDRLRFLGYNVRVQESLQGGRHWYRVQVLVDRNHEVEVVKKALENHDYEVWAIPPAEIRPAAQRKDAGGFRVLQVLASSNEQKAEIERGRLHSFGYDARIQESLQGDTQWYRVQVWVDRSQELEAVEQRLRGHGYDIWVIRPVETWPAPDAMRGGA